MTHRIGTPDTLPLDSLQTFEKNPRRGNIPAIKDSIIKNGQFKPVIVNAGTHTGRKNEILAGNHTIMAMRELLGTEHEITDVDVYVVDVDEEKAARIVLADNRTSDLGTYNNTDLLNLLESVDHDLDGTGYEYADLDALAAASSSSIADLERYLEDASEITDRSDDEPGGGDYEYSDTEDSDDSDDDEDEGDSPAPEHKETWLAVTFSVTAEQRRRIRVILNQVKSQYNLESQVDALMHILDGVADIDVEETSTANSDVDGDPSTPQPQFIAAEENTK